MARPLSNLHRQCQALWVKALQGPTTIAFPTPQEASRAKFVFYDAVRTAKCTGEGPADLLRAISTVEIALSRDKLAITLQLRNVNPFYAALERQLAEAGAGIEEPQPSPQAQAPTPDEAAARSLAEFQAAMGTATATTSPAPATNPYYSREDL